MRGRQRWNINRWCFNRGTLYCWKSGLEGNACGERKRNCQRGIASERKRRRTKDEEENEQSGGAEAPLDGRIVNDCRLKCPLRSGPRQAQWLDWQMVREICIRCEVFACQFCPRVVFGYLSVARSTMNSMEETEKKKKERKNRKEEINRRARHVCPSGSWSLSTSSHGDPSRSQ